jgi:hypothetical protein
LLHCGGWKNVRKEGKNKVLYRQRPERYMRREEEDKEGEAMLENMNEKVCKATGVLMNYMKHILKE